MTDLAMVALGRELGERVKVDEPLAPHTTLRIGGPAALYLAVYRLDDLILFARLAQARHVPIFILGNGSNILVRDGGVHALVIDNHCSGFSLDVEKLAATLLAESGASLPLVANKLARDGWSGLEWAIGVPGTVGGAVVGNAGAHGASVADNLVGVTILDSHGESLELHHAELGFEYRSSRFKQAQDAIILTAAFRLRKDDPKACIARMNEYTDHRRRTQPTEPSVGSMFKNPPGNFAGRLIEQAGLKGTRVGGAQVSSVHANFFVNRGGASARDVLELIDLVRSQVRSRFGIELELELQIVGQDVSQLPHPPV